MKARVIPAAVLMAILSAAPVALAQDSESARLERANRALTRWLDEDVAYIITPEERSAFDALTTDEEREQFIESFWLRRDPTPDTIANEYKDEHYRRIAYANERFASGIPGWKTDRGRIYIIHGEPASIDSKPTGGTYEYTIAEGLGTTTVFPFERWRYRYVEGIGTEVEFEFVDSSLSGEYRLALHPYEKDALAHVPGVGFTMWEQLAEDPEQARLDRGTSASVNNRISMFDRLEVWSKAFAPPEVKFKDLESIVTTNLSFNLLPFEMRADFVRVTEESVLTPITIQLRNADVAFKDDGGFRQGVLNIYGRVTGVNGRVAQVFEDTVTIGPIPPALFEQALDGVHVYQKILPLRPGLYKLDLVIKDLNSQNVGTVNERLAVPRFLPDQLSASSLILADLIQPLPPRQVGSGPFVLGNLKVRPSVLQEFRTNQELNYWLQVYNLKMDEALLKPDVTVETLISRGGREVERIVDAADQFSGSAQQMTLQKTVSLADYEPGDYSIEVRIIDNLSGDVLTQSSDFVVRAAPAAEAAVR